MRGCAQASCLAHAPSSPWSVPLVPPARGGPVLTPCHLLPGGLLLQCGEEAPDLPEPQGTLSVFVWERPGLDLQELGSTWGLPCATASPVLLEQGPGTIKAPATHFPGPHSHACQSSLSTSLCQLEGTLPAAAHSPGALFRNASQATETGSQGAAHESTCLFAFQGKSREAGKRSVRVDPALAIQKLKFTFRA